MSRRQRFSKQPGITTLLSAVTTATLLLSFPVPVAAAPPMNDDRANAVQLSGPLPITVVADLSEAAVQDPTDPSNPCGQIPLHTLWYEYTPEVSGNVAFLFEADFPGFLAVFRVLSNHSLQQVGCIFGDAQLLDLEQDQKYVLLASSYSTDASYGGSFSFSLQTPPPPMEITNVHITQMTYNPRTAVMRLTGSATCSRETREFGTLLSGRVRQQNKKTRQIVEDSWSSRMDRGCGLDARPFTAVLAGGQLFSPGQVWVVGEFIACDVVTCDRVEWTQTVRMTRTRD